MMTEMNSIDLGTEMHRVADNGLPCPVLIALDVAEELLDKFGHLHADPESVRGAIKISRAITERLHQVLPCKPGPDHRGQLACSLGNVVNDLCALLCQPNLQAGYALQLDALAKGQADERATGMFL